MIDLDEHKNQLNELWSKPVFDNLSASSITAMLKKREHSIVKKLKLVFRIEILICLIEIVQDCFALSSAKDNLFIGYNIFNIVLSAVFIFIFIKLIRRMNHPRLITLPLADYVKTLLSIIERFYRNYVLFAFYYCLIDFGYRLIRLCTIGPEKEQYGRKFTDFANSLQPIAKYSFLVGFDILFEMILYFLTIWIIRLFYRKRIKELRELSVDIQQG